MRIRRASWVILLAAAVVGCGAPHIYRVPIDDSPVRGPADAWVTLVEFGDFECPYCAQAAPTLRQILDTWPADVRLAFRHFPLSFHPRAMPAALAAECARQQDHFWEMYDALYNDPDHLEDADLTARASAIGLDVGLWTTCLSTDAAKQRIAADVELGTTFDVEGTPTFYINGSQFEGAQPFDAFRTQIEAALAAAQKSGIDRSEYYDKAILGR